jgi:acetate kinase
VRIAVLNVGSATWKVARVERTPGGGEVVVRAQRETPPGTDPTALLEEAFAEVGVAPGTVDAVGHRVVHGGTVFRASVLIDEDVERRLEGLAALAPLHNPPALRAIRAARALLPALPEVAVFDTAFHAGRPDASLREAIPAELADELGIQRFGFHGIAHSSLVEALAREEGRTPAEVSAVTLQLGGGCSACAVRDGRSRETSMGFSPLEGLVMPSRSGSLDPTVVLHLIRSGRSPDEVEALLDRSSGLLGVGGSSDVRALLAAEADGDARAALALELFVHRIALVVGGYWTLLGGAGALVFGGGIGAGSAEIRRRIAAALRAWDVLLDDERNAGGPPGRLSPPDARGVYAFHTDEESPIARETARLVGEATGSAGDRSDPGAHSAPG